MSVVRFTLYTLMFAPLMGSQIACNMVPRHHLAMAQQRAWQLYEQNKLLASDRDSQIRTNQTLSAEMQRIKTDLASATTDRETLQARLDNLQAERSQLQSRFTGMGTRQNPLPESSTRQFEDLARRYPDFEFDPSTGVAKFSSDILFESGNAEVRAAAEPLLRDFIKVLNTGEATQFNILVVGHTDDRRVVKPETRAKHPDNWHLSAHRAINVVQTMGRIGLKDNRMGVAGYGPYQPLEPNKDDKARARNRRVEIFVLAPNASVAGRDTSTPR